MGNLSEFLMEELNVETAFTIPLFGGIEVAESTVISWVIMAIIVILTLVLTRNMRVENPSKLQVWGTKATATCHTWPQYLLFWEFPIFLRFLA